MKLAYAYGVLAGGGCERRLGELAAWMLTRGHEVRIFGETIRKEGRDILLGQCGLPAEMIEVAQDDGPYPGNYADWLRERVAGYAPDLVSHQWYSEPIRFDCPSICTVHGWGVLPPLGAYEAIIYVWQTHDPVYLAAAPLVRCVDNWVGLSRLPFHEEPGEGVAFFGRSYKYHNARRYALCNPQETVVCFSPDRAPKRLAPNMDWRGMGDPAEALPPFRLVFASALAAMEAMALGRRVIVGHPHPFLWETCRFVTCANIESLLPGRFAYDLTSRPPVTDEEVREQAEAALGDDNLLERWALRRWLEVHRNPAYQIPQIEEFYRMIKEGPQCVSS